MRQTIDIFFNELDNTSRFIKIVMTCMGNEIDFLVIHTTKGVKEPFEVKYQNQIKDWDFQVMERSFGKGGTLLTLNETRKREKSRAYPAGEWCLFKLE